MAFCETASCETSQIDIHVTARNVFKLGSMEAMRCIFRQHPFVFIGLLSLCLLFLIPGLGSSPMRVLVMPTYLIWLGWSMAEFALVGASGVAHPLGVIVSGFGLLVGFAPYAFADYALDRWRQGRRSTFSRIARQLDGAGKSQAK